MEPIKLRWSSMYTYMKCQRRYDLQYRKNIVRNPGPGTRARILGSTIHAGLERALQSSFAGPADPVNVSLMMAAVTGARKYWRENYDQDRGRADTDYQFMMDEILATALNVLRYQVPRIGLGTKYRVASLADVLGPDDAARNDKVPFIEWNFAVDHEGKQTNCMEPSGSFDPCAGCQDIEIPFILTGTVDTVLQDIETGEFIVVDWKSRGVMPDERLVDLDGQLKFYSAVINALAGHNIITRTCQYQLRTLVPKEAKLTEKTRRISLAAISTTWEVWSKSVSALGLNPEDYREDMEPKMHPETDFTNPIFSIVTPRSAAFTIANVLNIGNMIARSEQDDCFPGIPSIMGCQFCDMKSYCRVIENGGDPTFILETEYTKGELDETSIDTEV